MMTPTTSTTPGSVGRWQRPCPRWAVALLGVAVVGLVVSGTVVVVGDIAAARHTAPLPDLAAGLSLDPGIAFPTGAPSTPPPSVLPSPVATSSVVVPSGTRPGVKTAPPCPIPGQLMLVGCGLTDDQEAQLPAGWVAVPLTDGERIALRSGLRVFFIHLSAGDQIESIRAALAAHGDANTAMVILPEGVPAPAWPDTVPVPTMTNAVVGGQPVGVTQ